MWDTYSACMIEQISSMLYSMSAAAVQMRLVIVFP